MKTNICLFFISLICLFIDSAFSSINTPYGELNGFYIVYKRGEPNPFSRIVLTPEYFGSIPMRLYFDVVKNGFKGKSAKASRRAKKEVVYCHRESVDWVVAGKTMNDMYDYLASAGVCVHKVDDANYSDSIFDNNNIFVPDLFEQMIKLKIQGDERLSDVCLMLRHLPLVFYLLRINNFPGLVSTPALYEISGGEIIDDISYSQASGFYLTLRIHHDLICKMRCINLPDELRSTTFFNKKNKNLLLSFFSCSGNPLGCFVFLTPQTESLESALQVKLPLKNFPDNPAESLSGLSLLEIARQIQSNSKCDDIVAKEKIKTAEQQAVIVRTKGSSATPQSAIFCPEMATREKTLINQSVSRTIICPEESVQHTCIKAIKQTAEGLGRRSSVPADVESEHDYDEISSLSAEAHAAEPYPGPSHEDSNLERVSTGFMEDCLSAMKLDRLFSGTGHKDEITRSVFSVATLTRPRKHNKKASDDATLQPRIIPPVSQISAQQISGFVGRVHGSKMLPQKPSFEFGAHYDAINRHLFLEGLPRFDKKNYGMQFRSIPRSGIFESKGKKSTPSVQSQKSRSLSVPVKNGKPACDPSQKKHRLRYPAPDFQYGKVTDV